MEPRGLLITAIVVGLLLAALAIDRAMADPTDSAPPRQERPRQPPAEAFIACEGKHAGDTVTIETPQGKKMEAVCETKGDRLAAKPLHPPPPPEQKP